MSRMGWKKPSRRTTELPRISVALCLSRHNSEHFSIWKTSAPGRLHIVVGIDVQQILQAVWLMNSWGRLEFRQPADLSGLGHTWEVKQFSQGKTMEKPNAIQTIRFFKASFNSNKKWKHHNRFIKSVAYWRSSNVPLENVAFYDAWGVIETGEDRGRGRAPEGAQLHQSQGGARGARHQGSVALAHHGGHAGHGGHGGMVLHWQQNLVFAHNASICELLL